jgi:hypothetical protein
VSKAQKKIMGLGKKAGFNEVDLDVVEELWNLRKEELSPEDLVQPEKEGEGGGENSKSWGCAYTHEQKISGGISPGREGLAVLNEGDLRVNKVQKGQDVFY